jgi:uncharacterized protein YjbI with pentapeptide repeats
MLSNLQDAYFDGAHLQGALMVAANLKGASLTNAELYSVIIDERTNFEDCNWWSANFEGDTGIDTNLLEELFRRYGDKVPKNVDMDTSRPLPVGPRSETLHPSVCRFMEEKRTQESQQS